MENDREIGSAKITPSYNLVIQILKGKQTPSCVILLIQNSKHIHAPIIYAQSEKNKTNQN